MGVYFITCSYCGGPALLISAGPTISCNTCARAFLNKQLEVAHWELQLSEGSDG